MVTSVNASHLRVSIRQKGFGVRRMIKKIFTLSEVGLLKEGIFTTSCSGYQHTIYKLSTLDHDKMELINLFSFKFERIRGNIYLKVDKITLSR